MLATCRTGPGYSFYSSGIAKNIVTNRSTIPRGSDLQLLFPELGSRGAIAPRRAKAEDATCTTPAVCRVLQLVNKMNQSQVISVLCHRANAPFSSRPAGARFILRGAGCAAGSNLACKFLLEREGKRNQALSPRLFGLYKLWSYFKIKKFVCY